MDYKIATVIVTFNRKELLIKCLNAVLLQSFKPHTVYIIDNASTDGTLDCVRDQGYFNTIIDGVYFTYNCLDENIGGAGGFYTGIKQAYESIEHFDGVWVMDDDGIPDKYQLENLCKYLTKYHYIAPLVLSTEDPNEPAFFSPERLSLFPQDIVGNYIGASNPFNGILYSRELIKTIGYPKKEMFIWGDEINYDLRAVRAGYIPILIKEAKHLHPKDRQIKFKTWANRSVTVPREDWKLYCLVRNRIYNTKIGYNFYSLFKRLIAEILDYTFYFIQNKSIKRLKVIFVAINDGIRNDFSYPRKFIK